MPCACQNRNKINLFFPSQDAEADHSGYVNDIGFRVSPLFLLVSECCKMVRESCPEELQNISTCS